MNDLVQSPSCPESNNQELQHLGTKANVRDSPDRRRHSNFITRVKAKKVALEGRSLECNCACEILLASYQAPTFGEVVCCHKSRTHYFVLCGCFPVGSYGTVFVCAN